MQSETTPLKAGDLSILVVDDMKSMRLTIRKMLQTLETGKKLSFAENGQQGMEILKTDKYDLALIDWNMPVMNGIEMLSAMRKNPAFRDIPAIMITAEAERDIVAEVAETEIDGYLLKPLTLESLDSKIKAVIDRINNPDPLTEHWSNAKTLEAEGRYQDAIEEVRHALRYKPSASRLIRRLGILHFKINKNAIAEKCLLKAVSVNKQDVVSRAYLADYYLKAEKLKKAGEHYIKILSLSDRYNDRAFDLGKKLLKNQLRKLALDIFSKIIAKSKKQTSDRKKIIDICIENEEYHFPLSLLGQAIRENPSNLDLLFQAGLILKQIGNMEKALRYFLRVDKKTTHTGAKIEIAKIYIDRQKVFQADNYLNQVLKLEPGNEEALELRRGF